MGAAVKDAAAMAAEIARRQRAGRRFCVATVVRAQAATAAKAGAKVLIDENGEMEGFIGGGCAQGAVKKAAARALEKDRPQFIRISPEELTPPSEEDVEWHKNGCPSRGTLDVFIEPVRPPPRLFVLGGSPVAQSLARQAAAMGYRVAAAGGAQDAAAFDGAPFLSDFDEWRAEVCAEDFVVVATQGREDLPALRAALQSAARYVAMVSSRAKAAHLCEQLSGEGLSKKSLARLKAPAGLDIHAIDADEIALSIIAEIIARRGQSRRQSEK